MPCSEVSGSGSKVARAAAVSREYGASADPAGRRGRGGADGDVAQPHLPLGLERRPRRQGEVVGLEGEGEVLLALGVPLVGPRRRLRRVERVDEVEVRASAQLDVGLEGPVIGELRVEGRVGRLGPRRPSRVACVLSPSRRSRWPRARQRATATAGRRRGAYWSCLEPAVAPQRLDDSQAVWRTVMTPRIGQATARMLDRRAIGQLDPDRHDRKEEHERLRNG